MPRIVRILALVLSCWLLPLQAADAPSAFVPLRFNGWRQVQVSSSHDAAAADSNNAGVLQEFGLTDFVSATYTRNNDQTADKSNDKSSDKNNDKENATDKIEIRALRFKDATGAYGAFTFYKISDMYNEQIGDQGYSLGNRILFYRGNILIDAKLSQVGPMSAADMRALADALPATAANLAILPAAPRYLPKAGYIKNSAKFAVGPQGLAAINAPLSASQVDFSMDPEIALGQYQTDSGSRATLTVIDYPTPQIAADRLRALQASKPTAPTGQTPPAFFTKRSGPLVAIVTGNANESEADDLLDRVNFEASLTWHDNSFLHLNDHNVLGLLVGIIRLIGFVLLIGLPPALLFGGVRAFLARRWAARTGDEGIVSLKLK